MSDRSKAIRVLTLNTVAFTVCFAVWMANGVLATFLADNGVFHWSRTELGWLIGIPVLSGSILRLPIGVLTDTLGGRKVYTLVMLVSALPMWLLSYAESTTEYFVCSLGFGISGTAFAVGIAYSSLWFPKQHQGKALGIFGAGNAGAALTSLGAPHLLRWLTRDPIGIEGWRNMPRLYAGALVAMAVVFWLLTHERKVVEAQGRSLRERLAPLGNVRVWRFGLYYFFVFGGFVALAQWLVPYYVSAYEVSLATAGLLASIFSLPSGVIRAAGGWLSDRCGARTVMYWVLGACLASCLLLIVPRMDIRAPGQGLMALRSGTVTAVTADSITIGDEVLRLVPAPERSVGVHDDPGALIWPQFASWQEARVRAGDVVERKQLLARGVTHIYFQANVWVFTALVFVVGIAMGIGKAAVYKHIPDYFPTQVGVVGGMVGVLGGLGGFVCPILFGWLLDRTGIWTTAWMFFSLLALVCLVWMHVVVRRMMQRRVPELVRQMESVGGPLAAAPASGRAAAAPRGAVQ